MDASNLRSRQLDQLDGGEFDVLVIGAGINGAVSTAALASRGLKVAIVDRGDFAGFTSQESSNLVWGGFTYLKTYEFGLVRKLCMARNRLITAFPSSIVPIDFLAVFDDQSPFPPWLASLGSYAYWGIGNFSTKPPRPMTTKQLKALEPAVDTTSVRSALRYADAYLPDNDARFVFNFIRDALSLGATAANYVEVTAVDRVGEMWEVEFTDRVDGHVVTARTKSIVNATGPFLDSMNEMLGISTRHRIALSKGIHLVVPRVGSGDRVLAFFDEDERLYYVIPMGDRSVIGTTDTKTDDPNTTVTEADRDFVLRQVNARLIDSVDIKASEIIGERSGVRPLVVKADAASPESGDWLQLSRRHEIELDAKINVVSIFGGKLTDCLNVGEEVVEAIEQCGIKTATSGEGWFGESGSAERDRFLRSAISASVPSDYAATLWRRYDMGAFGVLNEIAGDITMVTDQPQYSAAELRYVGANEMVVYADDFLRRRSGLALTTSASDLAATRPDIESALALQPAPALER